MKASVCVLFAVACWFVSQAEELPMKLTLRKVMHELETIKRGLGKSTTLINSPITNDLKDCCDSSALECFRANVMHLSLTDRQKKSQKIISRELSKSFIVNGVSSCKPEEIQKAQCTSCNSYRKVDAQTYVENFLTLLQKIYASRA